MTADDHQPAERDVVALAGSIVGGFVNVTDLPEWMQVPALGRNMRPLAVLAARTLLASDWYADALAQARREGAAEALDAARSRVDHEAVNVADALDIIADLAALRGDDQ